LLLIFDGFSLFLPVFDELPLLMLPFHEFFVIRFCAISSLAFDCLYPAALLYLRLLMTPRLMLQMAIRRELPRARRRAAIPDTTLMMPSCDTR